MVIFFFFFFFASSCALASIHVFLANSVGLFIRSWCSVGVHSCCVTGQGRHVPCRCLMQWERGHLGKQKLFDYWKYGWLNTQSGRKPQYHKLGIPFGRCTLLQEKGAPAEAIKVPQKAGRAVVTWLYTQHTDSVWSKGVVTLGNREKV